MCNYDLVLAFCSKIAYTYYMSPCKICRRYHNNECILNIAPTTPDFCRRQADVNNFDVNSLWNRLCVHQSRCERSGLSLAEYDDIVASQDDKCSECGCEHSPPDIDKHFGGYFALQPGTFTLLCGKCALIAKRKKKII